MFSGIIQNTEKVRKIIKEKDSLRIEIPIPKNWKIEIGESINIDGVCSTVERIKNKMFSVFYMPETLSKTNLSNVNKGHILNLEKSLTLNSLIGGHLVSGHIDTTGKISKIIDEVESRIITINLPRKFTKYIVYKGSICVNGVSLTIVEVYDSSFIVSLIPHTLKNTNLGSLKRGDLVNIEIDLIAKYLEKLLPHRVID